MVALIALLLLSSVVHAQSTDPLPPVSEPQEVRQHEVVRTETVGGRTITTTYDTFDRYTRIIESLPFGYRAETEYVWYPNTYLVDDGYYESIVQRETGRLLKGGEARAWYLREYDTSGTRTHAERTGFTVLLPVLRAIASIIGADLVEDEIGSS